MSFQEPVAAGGGNSRPRLPLGIQPIFAFPDRHTYSCHEYCLRIWFCALCLGPTARCLDAFVVGRHIRCLSEPTCPRCQEPVGRSLQKIPPRQCQDIFTKALHKGFLMMKTVMALARDAGGAGPATAGPARASPSPRSPPGTSLGHQPQEDRWTGQLTSGHQPAQKTPSDPLKM